MSRNNYDAGPLQDAIKVWKKIKKDASVLSIGDMMSFAQAIGHPHNPFASNSKVIDTDDPDVQRLIDLINGSNGYTILKMLMARNTDGNN